MNSRASVRLVEATIDRLDWMIAGTPPSRAGLTLPPGGVEPPDVLRIVREMAARSYEAGRRDAWMIVSGDEVVGLCSRKGPPAGGTVEIGYGIAESRRERGFATAGVAALLALCARDLELTAVAAETATANIASQRVLEHNAFERIGTRDDPEDGTVIRWERSLR